MGIGTVKPIDIEKEMKSSYLDYAMSVIVSRALPDVRDGLKPVQRRILYAMDGLGLHHNTSHKKSARIVGEVMGKYHPHGDASIYDTMVRMAQDFSLRYVLVDGQGNFGSVDNDPPAAMRYTEARLAEMAEEMLVDIDKNTVAFVPNFDDSLKEPSILPARLPNLLVNGSSGIAVGMTTNIPPHNLGEVCDAIAYLIDNPQATTDELLDFVTGPDFPTAAIILGEEGIKSAYVTGQGKITVRAKTSEVSTKGGKRQIIVTELPYQVNKAALVERIAELIKGKRITGIAEVRDESDREGMHLVIELRKGGQPRQILNNLYKYTPMQSAFSINMVALVNGQPRLINLKTALTCYINFRCEVITKRSQFELEKARNRAHILEGFRIALDNLEQMIGIIRQSETVDAARANLMSAFSLSQAQSQAILDMPLRRLAHIEQQKIADEYANVVKDISYLEDLLANPRKVLFLVKQDVGQLKSKYGDKRRTLISREEVTQFRQEDLVPHQKVTVKISSQGFIKRLPVSIYKLQRRGGRGVMGMVTREGDLPRHILAADTHDNLLFFSRHGRAYCLKCYEIPEDSSRTTKGMSIVNLLPIDLEEEITALLAVPNWTSNMFLLMLTKAGEIKKTSLDRFSSIKRNGLIAMGLKHGDELASARIATDSDDVILISQRGQAIRFKVKNLRTASRTSGGVRGIRLTDDCVVAMDVITREMEESQKAYLLTVSEKGFGKLTSIKSYSAQQRGGKGVKAHRASDKIGKLVAAKLVSKDEGYLVMLSTVGNVERIPIEQISVQSRNGRGVHLMALTEDDSVVSITTVGRLAS
ncbi:MAG: DNA gyrase subunit A [Dehalococcoidia bacterium]|nr:DNA gyrase subunit A [Dehalococcoidia bacterium]